MRAGLIVTLARDFVLAAGLLAGALTAAPPVSFATRPAVMDNHGAFILADFDGDGKADIISVQNPEGQIDDFQIEVQLSRGNNRFVVGPTAEIGFAVQDAIAVADFNGDGLMDVAVASSNARAVFVALQTPSGFKVSSIAVANLSSSLNNMVAVDINGDKKPDLVIPSSQGALILLNKGGGAFEAQLAGGPATDFVNVTDLNGDHLMDLVLSTVDCCAPVTVLLGDGHGGFLGPAVQPSLAISAEGLVVADLSGDGIPDIAGIVGNTIEILPGVGDGTFGAPVELALPSGYSGISLGAADLNGEGRLDLALIGTAGTASDVIRYLNLGKGNFGQPSLFPVAGAGSMAFGDINGDGAVDIGTGAFEAEALSILVNSGRGTFTDGQLTASAPAQSMVEGDFNGDGKPDLVTVSNQTGLTAYLNTGRAGNLIAPLTPLPYYTGSVVAGDFNGDGREDLVFFDSNEPTGETLLGNGDGTFFYQAPNFSLTFSGQTAVVADVNGDGKLDLVTNSLEVFLGNGSGQFTQSSSGTEYSCGSADVAVADFNRDGKPDLLSNCGGFTALYLGNGDGTFSLWQYLPGNVPQALAVADVNRDGIPDIVYAIYPGVEVLIGNGDGTFTPGTSIAAPLGTTGQILTGDFNGDGIVDVALLDGTDAVFSILTGIGDGTFHAPVLYGTGSNPGCMIGAEFHKPGASGLDDLAFCTGGGITLDLNTTK